MSPGMIPQACEAGKCPLCGQPNACAHCTTGACKEPCWCMKTDIPGELLPRVTPELRDKSCICSACVSTFHREKHGLGPFPPRPDEYYLHAGGLMVFRAR